MSPAAGGDSGKGVGKPMGSSSNAVYKDRSKPADIRESNMTAAKGT